MIPVRQQALHIPSRGRFGDCHRAVLASLFEVPLHEVPHFCEDGPPGDRFDARVARWLAERNLSSVTFPLQGTVQSVLLGVARSCPQAFWLLSGMSKTGVDHMVICRGPEIVHDPAANGRGLVGPCSNGFFWATFLTPLDPTHCPRQIGWRKIDTRAWWRRFLEGFA